MRRVGRTGRSGPDFPQGCAPHKHWALGPTSCLGPTFASQATDVGKLILNAAHPVLEGRIQMLHNHGRMPMRVNHLVVCWMLRQAAFGQRGSHLGGLLYATHEDLARGWPGVKLL